MTKTALAIVLSLGLPLGFAFAAHADAPWTDPRRWSTVPGPSEAAPEVIGSYTSGCVAGAVALPSEGPGFERMRPQRERYYGHPTLIAYLARIGAAAAAKGLPDLLVGDLAQPRGGPMPSDHGSHQSGLDVDVAFVRPKPGPLDAGERRDYAFTPVVTLETFEKTPEWSDSIVPLLEIAASDDAVDRIFVSPAVKREICEATGGDAGWLRKVRPWWGHHDHFHVRLRCPAGSGACRRQAPPPPSAGCGDELAWWFGPGPAEAARERRTSPRPARRRLPDECRDVLGGAAQAAGAGNRRARSPGRD